MGLGYSDVDADQDLSPQAQSDMLAALLDTLAIERADVVANDSGGAVAQLFAVQHPARVRTMLLTNCDVHEQSPPQALGPFIALARSGGAAEQWLAPQFADKDLARSGQGLGGLAYTDPASFSDEAIEYYFAPLLASPLRKAQFMGYAAAFEPNPLLAIEPALRRLEVPTRMVWGAGDVFFDVALAHWLDRTLPQSRGVAQVNGAKLFFPEEFPDRIAEEAKRLWCEP